MNNLKERLNVDDKTLQSLEMRMNGNKPTLTGVGSQQVAGMTNGGILADLARQRSSNNNSLSRGINSKSNGATD